MIYRRTIYQAFTTGLVVAALGALLCAKASGQTIPWTLEDRVKKAESRLDKLEWRLDQVEGKKAAAAPAEPRTKRVQVNGLWYDQHEDGRMEYCEECNKGKVVSWKPGAVYVPAGMNPNFRGTLVPYHGEPVYKREEVNPTLWQGVPQGSPFAVGAGGFSTTLTTSVITAGPSSTSYRVVPVGVGTLTGVAGVGRSGITSRFFRGGCGAGGCP